MQAGTSFPPRTLAGPASGLGSCQGRAERDPLTAGRIATGRGAPTLQGTSLYPLG